MILRVLSSIPSSSVFATSKSFTPVNSGIPPSPIVTLESEAVIKVISSSVPVKLPLMIFSSLEFTSNTFEELNDGDALSAPPILITASFDILNKGSSVDFVNVP